MVSEYSCETSDGGFPCEVRHIFNTFHKQHRRVFIYGQDDGWHHIPIIGISDKIDDQITIILDNEQEATLNITSYTQNEHSYEEFPVWHYPTIIPFIPNHLTSASK